jgi:DegV family protein with EDD domain
MAKEGRSVQEITDYLSAAALCMNTSFVINTLDYLHKGGRCSLAKLIASKILNIKPCIEVAEGAMRVGAKYTGRFEPTIDKYVAERLESAAKSDNIDLKRCYITHTTCPPEVVEQVRATIKRYAEFEEIIETRAGCTVSNHCGPNTLGIIFKQRTEYK